MRIEPLGDRALLIELGGGIDAPTLHRVREACARVATLPAITDIVPGYASVAVHFDPSAVRAADLSAVIAERLAHPPGDAVPEESREVEIPVHYGGDEGPDLAEVAAAHDMTPAEVIALHARATYTVHMIGFMPGFPYLGGLDPRLATPRRATPRTLVPAGSVGIGGAQTGIYPFDSPGGWHLIGRTTLRLFDAGRTPPALLRVGDTVRFVPA